MGQLTAKQYAPLSDDEQQVLRREAAARGIGNGLLARVLLLHGLEHLDDPEIAERVAGEQTAMRARISDGARAASRLRWGITNDEEGVVR
jgi:hypothetical protein